MPDDAIEKDTDAVRAGATPHMTRYILGISLGLIVIIMLILLALRSF